MKNIIGILLFLLSSCSLFTQSDDTWQVFFNQDSTLVGFKNKNGVEKIKPKFDPMYSKQKFENIIYVLERVDGSLMGYFLTKSGEKIENLSSYIDHYQFDCETEGFIRFTDLETEKIGLLDKNGTIVIPAMYDEISNVRNGLLMARANGEKVNLDSKESEPFFSGGDEMLINTKNEVLIDHFPLNEDLNYYSLEISKTANKSPIRKSFLAKDGLYYSFIDYLTEFKEWFKNEFLGQVSVDKLTDNLLKNIRYSSIDGMKKEKSTVFLANNKKLLEKTFLELKSPKVEFNYSNVFFENYRNDADFERYFNNCGIPNEAQYPLFSISTIDKENRKPPNSYSFLRTESGYKLIEIRLNSGILK